MSPGAQSVHFLGHFSSGDVAGSQDVSIYTTLLENAKLSPRVTSSVWEFLLAHTLVTTWSCPTFEVYPTGVCIAVFHYSFCTTLIVYGVKHFSMYSLVIRISFCFAMHVLNLFAHFSIWWVCLFMLICRSSLYIRNKTPLSVICAQVLFHCMACLFILFVEFLDCDIIKCIYFSFMVTYDNLFPCLHS